MMIRNLVRRSYGYSGWESVIRPVFLAFCLTCFCGVDAEEQANQLNTEAYHGNKSKHTIKQYKDYFLTIMQSRLRQKKPDSHCDTDSFYQCTSGNSP